MDGEKRAEVDFLQVANVQARSKRLEEWGRRKEKERCRSLLDNMKKGKLPGKPKHKQVRRSEMYRAKDTSQ